MKYVYIVTRYTQHSNPGVIEVPNLGVYSNLLSAQEHFNRILKDRINRGSKKHWTLGAENLYKEYNRRKLQSSYIEHKDGMIETLLIEQWKI